MWRMWRGCWVRGLLIFFTLTLLMLSVLCWVSESRGLSLWFISFDRVKRKG